MRKNLILAAAACVALVACNKEVSAPTIKSEPCEVTISLASRATKATVADTDNEAKVSDIQVFVFNGDVLDVYGSDNTGATEITLKATTGSRKVVAVVNAPDFSSVATYSALMAQVSLLSNNSSDKFEMIGETDVTLAASSAVTVNVDRLAARLRLMKITRNFSAPALAALSADKCQVVRVYATNAVGNILYSKAVAEPVKWHSSDLNPEALIETSFGLIYNKLQTAYNLAEDASYESNISLYTYPNATAEDGDAAKITRIVLEMLIDGAYYTYPIPVQNILSNKSYDAMELVITRLGNPSNGDDVIDPGEDDPIVSEEIPFTVVVNDWEQVLLGTDGTVTI